MLAIVDTATTSTALRLAAATMMSAAISSLRRSKRLVHLLIASTPTGDVATNLEHLPPEYWPIAAQMMKLRANAWSVLYLITDRCFGFSPPDAETSSNGDVGPNSRDQAILIECCTPEGDRCCYVQPFERDVHGNPIFTRAPYFLEVGSYRSEILGIPTSA